MKPFAVQYFIGPQGVKRSIFSSWGNRMNETPIHARVSVSMTLENQKEQQMLINTNEVEPVVTRCKEGRWINYEFPVKQEEHAEDAATVILSDTSSSEQEEENDSFQKSTESERDDLTLKVTLQGSGHEDEKK